MCNVNVKVSFSLRASHRSAASLGSQGAPEANSCVSSLRLYHEEQKLLCDRVCVLKIAPGVVLAGQAAQIRQGV